MKIGYCHQKEEQCHLDLTCDISASFQTNTSVQADYSAPCPVPRGTGSERRTTTQAAWLFEGLTPTGVKRPKQSTSGTSFPLPLRVGDHYRLCTNYQLWAYLPAAGVVPVYSSGLKLSHRWVIAIENYSFSSNVNNTTLSLYDFRCEHHVQQIRLRVTLLLVEVRIVGHSCWNDS